MSDSPRFWDAHWIYPSQDPQQCFGAFVFRKVLALDEVPPERVVRITADQRFRLYVNGTLCAWGPARGDTLHWPFDEVDIASQLKTGENIIHAVVWSFGDQAPMAQMTARTGFILEGEGLSTPGSDEEGHWEMAPAPGYRFGSYFGLLNPTYFVSGPGEETSGEENPGWELLGAMDLDWQTPKRLGFGKPDLEDWKGPVVGVRGKEEGSGVGESSWHLVPRKIPAMLYCPWQGSPKIVDRATDERLPWTPLELKDGEEALLDFSELLTAFPRIKASGNGRLRALYAEALYLPDGTKGHRDITAGKSFSGNQDRFVPFEEPSVFEPLWWRCFRYVLLVAEGDIRVESFECMETGYPLEVESDWVSSGQRHDELMDVAVRTVKRCAGETYFDCPYYEQLQYVGDTRIQAQIGRFLSRDRRLQKQAIDAFADSVQLYGLTASRHPSRELQIIPSFSLWWIMMLWDQWMYDEEGIRDSHLGFAYGILDWWDETLEENPAMNHWAFADWVDTGLEPWSAGVPKGGLRSAVQTLILLYAKIHLGRMTGDSALLEAARARLEDYEEKTGGLVVDRLYDPEGTPAKHSAALLRLCQKELGIDPLPWPTSFGEKTAEASLFYQWYTHQAQPAADYEDLMKPWRDQLDLGLTTFLEIPDPSRSDCHAWSSHPILGFFQRIAGVTSAAPGWKEVLIAPNPGSVKSFRALIPHPQGDLRVELADGEVTVSSPVPYTLIWNREDIVKG
jgi:alpha-L-rhamnosidase